MTILEMLDSQPSPLELVVMKLIDSGLSYRDLAERLEVSHTTIQNIYTSVKEKIDGKI